MVSNIAMRRKMSTILIVDDEPLAVERVQVICAEIPSVRVIGTASDGAAALPIAIGAFSLASSAAVTRGVLRFARLAAISSSSMRAVTAFIDRDNINTLLRENGITGDIGLLSIDIDGNDYWIWEAIDCISPRIVICEYDSLLGPDRKVTTPYDPAFDRITAHYSFLYGGASLAALDHLARRKGYALVGSNSAGNNAFFVREDVRGTLPAVTPTQAYVQAKFRNSRDRQGRFTFLPFAECRQLIADMPVVDVEQNITIPIRDIVSTASSAL